MASGIMEVAVPFTLSHPAAAIPFFRTRLVASALVIGCMAPDFEYFIRRHGGNGFGHTLPGVFVFDLPASLVVLWLFHAYAKVPLHSWLPANVRQRIDPGPRKFPARSLAQFALVVLSILIGTATHILWDSFTHRNLWLYKHWELLHRTIELPVYGPLEYLRVIQHVSTILGALALLIWFRNWFRRTAPIHPPRQQNAGRNALLIICIVALVAAVLRGFLSDGIPISIGVFKGFLAHFVEMLITAFWLQVVAYGAYTGRFSRG